MPKSKVDIPLLAQLWIREPTPEMVERAVNDCGFPPSGRSELAVAFADLLLINLPPYGSVFLDSSGELNGPSTETLAALFDRHGYDPPERREVAAPDHLGLCLGYLGSHQEPDSPNHYDWSWMLYCCIAVLREPGVHPFYAYLADMTAKVTPIPASPPREPFEWQSPLELRDDQDQVTLGRIVRFFLAPAHCGLYMSRGRIGAIANELGMRLPFGARFEVMRTLFQSAGEVGFGRLMACLRMECSAWSELVSVVFGNTAQAHDAQARLVNTLAVLDEMERTYAAEVSSDRPAE